MFHGSGGQAAAAAAAAAQHLVPSQQQQQQQQHGHPHPHHHHHHQQQQPPNHFPPSNVGDVEMDYPSFFPNQQIQTVGTSYYFSSLYYLGYSRVNHQSQTDHLQQDVKPNLWWVSDN